jgi:predicted ATPase
MLTELRIQNFKAWRDTKSIRLAPLTVIFGANSSGKSSLGHLLLALKQTTQLSDRRRALHLGDRSSPVDLGTFEDCIYAHNLKSLLQFSISWRTPTPMIVRNSIAKGEQYSSNDLRLSTTIKAGRADQPEVVRFEYKMLRSGSPVLTIAHGRDDHGAVFLDSNPLKLVKATGRVWPLQPPEKFYRFSDVTLARYQNADFLAGFALQTENLLSNLYYLGPLRRPPERTYQWSGDVPQDVGQEGQATIAALLAAQSEGRSLNRGPKARNFAFAEFIARWLEELGVISSFEVRPVARGRKEFEVLVKTGALSPQVKLTDVGFGVSQLLPALVQSFYAPPNSTVWMEQPEIHLHPSVQSRLADVFISAIQAREGGRSRNLQLIVESHSEHLLTRLQLRIAQGRISNDDVAVYFCKPDVLDDADLEPLKIDETGEIENWPENFFGNEMEDIRARTLAGLSRKTQNQDSSK